MIRCDCAKCACPTPVASIGALCTPCRYFRHVKAMPTRSVTRREHVTASAEVSDEYLRSGPKARAYIREHLRAFGQQWGSVVATRYVIDPFERKGILEFFPPGRISDGTRIVVAYMTVEREVPLVP